MNERRGLEGKKELKLQSPFLNGNCITLGWTPSWLWRGKRSEIAHRNRVKGDISLNKKKHLSNGKKEKQLSFEITTP